MSNSKVKCGINNQWMWSIENACITVYSPTGGYVRMDKRQLKNDTPKELVELVWRIADERDSIELTAEEMKLLTTYPKAKVYKVSTKSNYPVIQFSKDYYTKKVKA